MKKITSFVNRPVFIFKPQYRNFLSQVYLHFPHLYNKHILSTSWVSGIADAILRIWPCFRRQDISCSLAVYGLAGERVTIKIITMSEVRSLMVTVPPPHSKPEGQSQGQMGDTLCFK